jgi:hypothetical protein
MTETQSKNRLIECRNGTRIYLIVQRSDFAAAVEHLGHRLVLARERQAA